jgi:hypothetical protein
MELENTVVFLRLALLAKNIRNNLTAPKFLLSPRDLDITKWKRIDNIIRPSPNLGSLSRTLFI